MSCSSGTRSTAPGAEIGHRPSTLAAGIGSLIVKAWHGYWDWRVKRTTIFILRSLDRRTLHDIGVDPSEIESMVHDAGRERRRRHDASWPRGFGGA